MTIQFHPDRAPEDFGTVLPGENFQEFCGRAGADPRLVVRLNEQEMFRDAAARGFDTHMFTRRNPQGEGLTQDVIDFHVFAGQRLRLTE